MFGQKFGRNTNSILEVQGDEAIRGSRSWSFTNAEGYRMGRYVAAFALDELSKGNTKPLWQRDDFLARAHNGLRVTDLMDMVVTKLSAVAFLHPTGMKFSDCPMFADTLTVSSSLMFALLIGRKKVLKSSLPFMRS